MKSDRNAPILIADDYRDTSRLLRQMLKQIGFNNVEDVTDGYMAIGRLREKAFSLLLCDVIMEPVDGLALLRSVRANRLTSILPVIMITGSAERRHIEEAQTHGIHGYILKPFSLITLRDQVVAVLGDPRTSEYAPLDFVVGL